MVLALFSCGSATITETVTGNNNNNSVEVSLQRVVSPAMLPQSGNVEYGQTVSITTNTADAQIYFTVDGSEPTTSSSLYTSEILIYSDEIIKAIAVKEGMPNSAVVSASYSIDTSRAVSPSMTPANRLVAFGGTVSITTHTDGATIHYTTDGTLPTSLNAVYDRPIAIYADKTIKAISIKDGLTDSSVSTVDFKINQSAGIFGWPHGTCQIGEKIYIATRTSPATVTVFNNPNDLTDYQQVTLTGQNRVDLLIYDSVNNKLYATSRNTGGGDHKLNIIQIDPDNINNWSVVYSSNTPSASFITSSPIVTDGTYVYGATSDNGPSTFFKIRISDWTLVAQTTWNEAALAHSAQLRVYPGKKEMYVTNAAATSYNGQSLDINFAKVDCDTMTYTTTYVQMPYYNPDDDMEENSYPLVLTDDMACRVIDDNGSICYLGSEDNDPSWPPYGWAVNTATMVVTRFDAGQDVSYGMFIYGNDLYSVGGPFDQAHLSVLTGIIIKYKDFDLEHPQIWGSLPFVPNELFHTSNGKMFVTDWKYPSKLIEFKFPDSP